MKEKVNNTDNKVNNKSTIIQTKQVTYSMNKCLCKRVAVGPLTASCL